MFVALEGVDGSGKTTLAKAVKTEIERLFPGDTVEILHRRQLTRPPMDEYEYDVEDYRPGTGRHVIADRWHHGEMIYGPLYRGKSALTTAMFRHIELFCLSRGIRVWHVTQPLPRIAVRLAERGDDYLQSHHVEHVMNEYYRVSDMAATVASTLVPPEGDLTSTVTELIKHAQYYENFDADLNAFPSYIGRRTPAVLLLGEKRGGKPPYPTQTAFLPVGGNSGSFLLEALPDPFWKRTGVANALEEDVASLIDVLAGPMVVALGKAASDRLTELGIEHAAAPHPQAVRRFHHDKKIEYGEFIARVAETGDKRLSWPK